MDQEWEKLLRGESVSFELRLRRPFIAEELIAGEKVEGFTCLIVATYPEKAEDGTVTGILGCLTDISRQKWVEEFQTRRMLEAVELRRQQENFIDMTSQYAHFLSASSITNNLHSEMRNPLSAIVQCADWTGTSLAEFDDGAKAYQSSNEIKLAIQSLLSYPNTQGIDAILRPVLEKVVSDQIASFGEALTARLEAPQINPRTSGRRQDQEDGPSSLAPPHYSEYQVGVPSLNNLSSTRTSIRWAK
jgi:hypothetical protein